MSKVCVMCKKGPVSGNQVSHSHIRTKRSWGANVHKTDVVIDGKMQKNVYVCTRCMRTLKKAD